MEKKKRARTHKQVTRKGLSDLVKRHRDEGVSGLCGCLGHGVATVHTEVCAGDVAAGIREQIGDRAHEVLWFTHLANRDQRSPVFVQLWVIVKDFLGSGKS